MTVQDLVKSENLLILPLSYRTPYPGTSQEIIVPALCDSGSRLSFIGKRGLQILELNQEVGLPQARRVNTFIVQMANGSRAFVDECYCLNFLVGNQIKTVSLFFLSSLSFSVIIGLDFLRENAIITDASNNLWWYSENPTQKFQFLSSQDEFLVSSSSSSDPLSVVSCGVQLIDQYQREIIDKIVTDGLKSLETSPGLTTRITHKIDVGSANPIKQRAYNYSPKVLQAMHTQLDSMLESGIVEPSQSPWASPVVMVKKGDSYRFCIDFRRVNACTKKDSYPMPNLNTLLDSLRHAAFLSKLDLKQAFLQVPLADEESRDITSFIVPGRGLFRFRTMSFGLTNSPATFQRLADSVFMDLYPHIVVFLDDILVCTPDFKTHCDLLQEVFRRLKQHGLQINSEKCNFGCQEVRYLGYLVNAEGISVDPEKTQVVTSYPTPTNVAEVRRFLGMASWYRRFISDFSNIVSPLTSLLGKKKIWVWGEEQNSSLEKLKSALTSAPVLARPDFDLSFTLFTDASACAIGCSLTQIQDGNERVITYCSRTLSSAERNYSVTELECLAIIWGIEKNRQYLEGTEFKVVTDHSCLKWLLNLKNPSGRLARWILRLQPYRFSVEYRKGKFNCVADALSRIVSPFESLTAVSLGISNSEPTQDEWYDRKFDKVQQSPDLHPDWKVENNKLFYHQKSFLKGELQEPAENWKLVIPWTQRSNVLKENHDDPQSGHLGIAKTHWRIGRLYYWPGMYRDIVRYVLQCDVCQRVKPANTAPRGLMYPRYLTTPWHTVSADIMGPFPTSSFGNKYLLVFEDVFTKWVELVPIRAANSSIILGKFKSFILNRFGTPVKLITDNASNFVSSMVRSMADTCGIKHQTTPLYHCQANPTERANRNIRQLIITYLDKERHTKWDKYIGELQFALNSTVHSSTKYSPAFLNFGRELLPMNSLYRQATPLEQDAADPVQLRKNTGEWAVRMGKLKELSHLVEQNLLKASLCQSRGYNLRRRPELFSIGDQVLRKTFSLSSAADHISAKLNPKYEGPFTVTSVSPGGTCVLIDSLQRNAGSWHPSKLKKYVTTSTAEEGCVA